MTLLLWSHRQASNQPSCRWRFHSGDSLHQLIYPMLADVIWIGGGGLGLIVIIVLVVLVLRR